MRRQRWREPEYKISAGRCGDLKFNDAQFAEFRKQVIGRIVVASDPDYNSCRGTFMLAFQHFPQIIVYCVGFSDVVACIRFARRVGLHWFAGPVATAPPDTPLTMKWSSMSGI